MKWEESRWWRTRMWNSPPANTSKTHLYTNWGKWDALHCRRWGRRLAECRTEGGHLLPIGTRVNPPKVSNRWLAWWNQAFKNTDLTAEPGGERQGRKTAEAVGARAQFQLSKLGNIKRRISRMVVRLKHDAWHTANRKETSPPPSSHWGWYSGGGYKVQME